jgi:short-subunit dehydrogenase
LLGFGARNSLRAMNGHVLITGASSGIGRALALEFALQGHPVGLVARRAEALETLAEEVRSAGGQAAVAAADVGSETALNAAVASLETALGPVEILVANAGISRKVTASRLNLADLALVMDVNYLGAVRAVAAVLPGMLERGRGQLVVVSSVAAFRGLPGSGAYSASKAAISNFWEALRGEVREAGIACTTIHPGYIDTPLTRKNKYPMPFLVDVNVAARKMVRGILARKRQVNLPWKMIALMTLVRHLPDWIYDRIMGGFTRPHRPARPGDQSGE